jgi:hypothetical protein
VGPELARCVHTIVACLNTFECNFILKSKSSDLEKSRSAGEDSEMYYAGTAFTMEMISGDKI